jgi:hypothetical protein
MFGGFGDETASDGFRLLFEAVTTLDTVDVGIAVGSQQQQESGEYLDGQHFRVVQWAISGTVGVSI